MDKNQKEKLQSRRDFFKKMIKKTLPIIGLLAIPTIQVFSNNIQDNQYCKGCWGACQSNCTGSCEGSCSGCGSSCSTTCSSTCRGACDNTCKNSCENLSR